MKSAPESKIVVSAIPRMISENRSFLNEKVNAVNEHLRSKCAKSSRLCFIDANPPLVKSNYKEDGYHFNNRGISFYSRYISNYISHGLNFPLEATQTSI